MVEGQRKPDPENISVTYSQCEKGEDVGTLDFKREKGTNNLFAKTG